MQVVRNARVVRKEGGEAEYVEEELNDLSLATMLKKAYTTYRVRFFPSVPLLRLHHHSW